MRTRTGRLLRAAAIVLPGLALAAALAAPAASHASKGATTTAGSQKVIGPGDPDRGVQWA